MSETDRSAMAKSRALLTDLEREQIAWEHGDDRRYQAASRIRRRIKEELTEDVEVLAEEHPDLLEELREVVCPFTATIDDNGTLHVELPDDYDKGHIHVNGEVWSVSDR